jgi:DNA-binding response OmpR family regulator
MAAPVYKFDQVSLLVIEDQPFMQDLLASVLKALGLGRVIAMASAEDAVSLLSIPRALREKNGAGMVDLIISDWFLGKKSGGELLRWVRLNDDELVRFIPFIIVSGYAGENMVCRARDLGADEFLAKPFSVNTVAARLLAVIDNRRQFIKNQTYFGPDRRRKDQPINDERRRDRIAAAAEAAGDGGDDEVGIARFDTNGDGDGVGGGELAEHEYET